MNVVSSVRLTESPQPYSLAIDNCLPQRLSTVFRTRTIKFKWYPFSRGIISHVSWGIRLHEGGSFHTFRLIRPDQYEYAISKRGPHYTGDMLFRVTDRLGDKLIKIVVLKV